VKMVCKAKVLVVFFAATVASQAVDNLEAVATKEAAAASEAEASSSDARSKFLLPSVVAEHELAGIDFYLTFLKQLATLAMFMAVGIPISYNHLTLAIARVLFGIYPYLKFYT